MVDRHPVTVSKLDDVLGDTVVDFLSNRVTGVKIDAEGMEPWVGLYTVFDFPRLESCDVIRVLLWCGILRLMASYLSSSHPSFTFRVLSSIKTNKQVVRGGDRFFKKVKPSIIHTEINSRALETNTNSSGIEYIFQIMALGYKVSNKSFLGPFLSDLQVQFLDIKSVNTIDLFFVLEV